MWPKRQVTVVGLYSSRLVRRTLLRYVSVGYCMTTTARDGRSSRLPSCLGSGRLVAPGAQDTATLRLSRLLHDDDCRQLVGQETISHPVAPHRGRCVKYIIFIYARVRKVSIIAPEIVKRSRAAGTG